MSKETVDLIIEGGNASAGPQMGQAFGPLGVNIQGILDKINDKTKEMKGMKLPVKVVVDTDSKDFELEIGSPPISELIKKEIGLDKGSGMAHLEKKANIGIEHAVKIAKMKKDSMLVNNLKSAVKSTIGSCGPMGILIEGKEPREINEDIDKGKYDNIINEEITEVSEDKKKELKIQFAAVVSKLEKEKEELEEQKKEEEEAAAPIEEDTEEAPTESESESGEESKEDKKETEQNV